MPPAHCSFWWHSFDLSQNARRLLIATRWKSWKAYSKHWYGLYGLANETGTSFSLSISMWFWILKRCLELMRCLLEAKSLKLCLSGVLHQLEALLRAVPFILDPQASLPSFLNCSLYKSWIPKLAAYIGASTLPPRQIVVDQPCGCRRLQGEDQMLRKAMGYYVADGHM